MPERDLEADVEQAEKLMGLLGDIEETYENLPKINLADDIEAAEKLLGLLRTIRQEIENLPELPEA
jgi:hypothetical protein